MPGAACERSGPSFLIKSGHADSLLSICPLSPACRRYLSSSGNLFQSPVGCTVTSQATVVRERWPDPHLQARSPPLLFGPILCDKVSFCCMKSQRCLYVLPWEAPVAACRTLHKKTTVLGQQVACIHQ